MSKSCNEAECYNTTELSTELASAQHSKITYIQDKRLLTEETVDNKKQQKTDWIFFREDIKWINVLPLATLHLIGIYGFITYPYIGKYKTLLWGYLIMSVGGFGVTAGVHRYWSHRSFKANLLLQSIFALCYISARQIPIKKWVRLHRLHHKFTETDADPHNIKRGFFFSHVGWFIIKLHPEVYRKSKLIDMSDIENDPVVRFVDRYFILLYISLTVIYCILPVYLWQETYYYAILVQFMVHFYTTNLTFIGNSLVHMWGSKPFDKNIAATDNTFVNTITHGEGCHNYHHTFPYDYSTPEIGSRRFSLITELINLFAKIGWAYDLKTASESVVKKTMRRKGDGSIFT